MIHLICQNSGNVWVSAETVQAAVEKIGEIGASEYDYLDVSEYDRRNFVDGDHRWYFSTYRSRDEFAINDADELSEAGEFAGYIALVELERLE
ncbi:hypothetical protein GGQ73_001625 [Rhizobium skierniewicense]|uniref:Uncharacterized protein n=1 Tax=Rhizobium skierniewicense TaxID=984260 RepID=A0A7W6CBY3_9HYPH|nr:hypothetical protein [Rhizobium skierniewicense]MBB3945690.1 hypothetical protein [Rhizobium skierniewicense]